MYAHKIPALLAFIALSALAACNTMQGLGEDMRQGGVALSDAATQARDNMSEPAPAQTSGQRISMDRARSLALAARTGEISDGELVGDPNGSARYDFTVHSDRSTYHVAVDAQTGAIVENRLVQVD